MIVKFKIPDNIFNELKKDIKKTDIEYNENLAGNIRQEYSLANYRKKYEQFIISKAFENEQFAENIKSINILYPNDQALTLGKLWVNFQKKHEFNPVHKHDGVLSFILFIQVPFMIEEELQKAPGVKSNGNLAGHLQFLEVSPHATGNINVENLSVDKTWEQTGLIFRSYLNHCVYPFFSTDEKRITVSGNVYFNNHALELNE